MYKILWNFNIKGITESQPKVLALINNNKKSCHHVDFAGSMNLEVEIKESKKIGNDLDHAKKLKNQKKEAFCYLMAYQSSLVI